MHDGKILAILPTFSNKILLNHPPPPCKKELLIKFTLFISPSKTFSDNHCLLNKMSALSPTLKGLSGHAVWQISYWSWCPGFHTSPDTWEVISKHGLSEWNGIVFQRKWSNCLILLHQLEKHMPKYLRRKLCAELKPKTRIFEIQPTSGVLDPGERSNMQVKFMPKEEVSFKEI